MARVELSDYFEVLAALLEAFEKYPRGAMWGGGLLALAIICYTFVSVYKSKILKIEQAFNELARKEGEAKSHGVALPVGGQKPAAPRPPTVGPVTLACLDADTYGTQRNDLS